MSLLWLLGSYVAALVAWQLFLRRWLEPLRVGQTVALSALLAAPGVAWGYHVRGELAEREGWLGAAEHLRDRVRLQATPSIAPALISTDRPQSFFVYAPGAGRVELRLGAPWLAGNALGRGIFRIDYDPRRDGLPRPGKGVVRAQLRVDGREVEREMHAVTPLAHPRWFCLAPGRRAAATVSEETDELIVYDAGRVSRVAVGDGPVDCAFSDERHVVVSHRYDALRQVDLDAPDATRELPLPAAQGRMALSPDRSLLAVASNGLRPEIALVALPAFRVVGHVPLKETADWLAFGRDYRTLIATRRTSASMRLFEWSGASFVPKRVLRFGRPAATLARTRDGARVWVAVTDYRPDGSAQLGNHFVQDQLLAVSTDGLRVVDRILTARRSDRQSKPGDVDEGCAPRGIDQARDGSLIVAFTGSEALGRLGRERDMRAYDLSDTALPTPLGVVELADATVLVSSPAGGALGVIAEGARRPHVLRLAPSDAWLLRHDTDALARRIGERGFYEATRSGIACESCHLHADSDRAGYNLGDHRLVNTLSVRGLFATSPYLRDGSYPRVRDLDEVAQTLYRGYLRHQPGRAVTLEAFVQALPRLDPLPRRARDPAAERRGVAAFFKAHCDRCHTPPAFTNLGQVPLHALFPSLPYGADEVLDVPSLLSVWASGPYLNDGRATTLESVIDEYNHDNRHGDTAALSSQERRDLVALLRSL